MMPAAAAGTSAAQASSSSTSPASATPSQTTTRLTPSAFSALLDALDTVDRPLGDVCLRLSRSQPLSTTPPLALSASLTALLQDDLLPDPPQRLVALYLLYHQIVTSSSLTSSSSSSSSSSQQQSSTSGIAQTSDNAKSSTSPSSSSAASAPSNDNKGESVPPTGALSAVSAATLSSVPLVDRLVDSPLSIVLFELQDARDARAAEQLFLSHLLSHAQSSPPDTPVPAQIAQAPAVTLWNALEGAMRSGAAVPKLNMTELRANWTTRHPHAPGDDPQQQQQQQQPLLPVSGVVRDPQPDDPDPAAAALSASASPLELAASMFASAATSPTTALNSTTSASASAASPLAAAANPAATAKASPTPRSLAEELGEVVTLEDFAPPFVRLPPPLMPIAPDCKELRWIDPEPLHELIWDPDMCTVGARSSELRDVIARALKTPIPETQKARVIAHLEADPKLVHACGLTPQRIPDLVQNNAELATKVLLKLESSKQLPQYLNALANMELNLHSIEVVNRLVSSMRMPPDFVHSFIDNCIKSCDYIPDKSGQVRMVRIVCLFLRNLIKNKAIDPQDLSIEVQTFCIEYSRIREAADLFRLLKSFGAQQ